MARGCAWVVASLRTAAAAGRTRIPSRLAASSQCRSYFSKEESKSPYKFGKHRSNAEELIDQFPVIEVDRGVAICDGGGGALGHPLEFIQLATVSDKPQTCKYCGLRFARKNHH
ncbi:unnamed protein product [Phaeothamnion confervicola]